MTIGNQSVVSIHYELRDASQNVLDSSKGNDPLTYMHGVGGLIPGLEDALLGKTIGDAFNVVIAPTDGYGDRDERLVQQVPRSTFEGVDPLEVGMQFRTQNQDGSPGQVITIAEVDAEEVRIDANHPLAGVELHFDVEVVAIRDATEDELSHGHAH